MWFTPLITSLGRLEGVQGHPCLHSNLETSLDYLRPCLKKKKIKIKGRKDLEKEQSLEGLLQRLRWISRLV